MNKVKNFSILLLLVLLAFSCSRREDNIYGPGMGGIRIDLATQAPATRAELEDGSLNADDFKVEIINSQGVIFKRWATFAEYKAQESTAVQMNAGGPYTLRATLGDSTASGWNSWFFKGEQQFTVLPQETVTVAAVCRMANIKVAVKYGENVLSEYTSYETTVTNRRGSLVFDMAHKDEAGYMPADPLTVDVALTDKNGKTWYFRNGSEISAAPGDFITLNLDTDAVPTQNIGLTITVDRTTNDSTVVVELPSYMLPKDAPVLSPETGGFDSEGNLSMVEGIEPNANISYEAVSGLAGCVMTVNSSYLKSLGWPETLDFFNLSASDKNIINRDGLVYSVEDGLKMGSIDLSAVARKFSYVEDAAANVHSFTIKLTDKMGKTTEATFKITPVKAEISLGEIAEGNVWAARLENVVLSTSNGDVSLLYPEVMPEGGSWVRPQYTSSISGTSNTVTITGLTPGTKYSVRARYNNGVSADVREVTTEAAQQVENAGFEEWYGTVVEEEIPIYFPYLQSEQDKWWDSNNRQTAAEEYSTYNSYKCFPTTWYVEGRTGEKAASIMAVAVNGWNSELMGTGKTPGELFIGTYGGERGHAFGSRPSKLRFYYKYIPDGSDTWQATIQIQNGSEVIAEKTVTSSASVNGWTEYTLDLDYSDKMKKATGIYIHFRQSTSDEPNTHKHSVTTPAGSYTIYGGSTLTVDDIELIYE